VINRNKIFINGQWIDSAGRDTLTVMSPVTEKPIATVARGTAEDVDRAAKAAAAAFEGWSRTSVQERIQVFERLSRLTAGRVDEIANLVVAQLGYPHAWAKRAHSDASAEELQIIADTMPQVRWSEQMGNTVIDREPAGIVGAITSWNAPLRTIISKAGAAMAAGCCVVVKPAEIAPLDSYVFAEMVAQAGVPPGVFNLVSGTGPEVGEAIATHPLVEMVSLTGSVRAGVRVMELASRTVKRVHLELGGKSANMILDAANFERAVVDGIEDAMRNTGQACGGLTRMLVPRARLKDAEELAASKAATYVLGDPYDPKTNLGPVISAQARDRIRSIIRSGIEQGAKLVAGGPEAPDGLPVGYFVRPTVFSGDNTQRVAREEVFGPVVVIIPFDDEDDAVSIANDSPFGLAAGVWSADPEHARKVARRLRVGRVRINGAPINKRACHGGFKLSGIGREWGRIGIEEFLEYKAVIG
jgi:acyl-CoA reductase-like NAD-dependent aldehyde dehydrogenase